MRVLAPRFVSLLLAATLLLPASLSSSCATAPETKVLGKLEAGKEELARQIGRAHV